MSNAYVTRMPAGIAGDVSRKGLSKIQPEVLDADYPVTLYGLPVKMSSGKIRPIASGDTIATAVIGFIVRPYPFQAATSEALAAGTPNPAQPADIMRSGYMTVKCNSGTPSKGGVVYCRKTADDLGVLLIGGIEAAADSAKCEAITGAKFEGAADADGNVEISYNI